MDKACQLLLCLQVKHMETGTEEVVPLADLADNLHQEVKKLAELPVDLVAKKRQAALAEQTSGAQTPAQPTPKGKTAALQQPASASAAPQQSRSQAAQASRNGSQQQSENGLKGLKKVVSRSEEPGIVQQTMSALDLAESSHEEV